MDKALGLALEEHYKALAQKDNETTATASPTPPMAFSAATISPNIVSDDSTEIGKGEKVPSGEDVTDKPVCRSLSQISRPLPLQGAPGEEGT